MEPNPGDPAAAHRWRATRATLGVGEGQELLHFLIGLEGIRGKLIERADRPGTLRGEQLRDRQARTGRRLARVTVCARRAH
jgi:hypothetical protein